MILGDTMDILNSANWSVLGPLLAVISLLVCVILSKVFGEGGQ
jgi:ABC-type antimicrobial peptide transport system permease subunit